MTEPTCDFCNAADKFRCRSLTDAYNCDSFDNQTARPEVDPSKFSLVCGDAVANMRALPDGSVDVAVFDPPYPTISGGSNDKPDGDWSRPSGILTQNDGKIFAENDITPDDYLPELYRVMADQSHVYLMTNFLGLKKGLMATVIRHGFDIHNLLVWKKNNATPNRWYMKDLEYTIFARKGKAFAINDKGSKSSQDVFPHPLDWPNVPSPKTHPTEKPVNLMRSYIQNSAQEGATILDPFMGTGATGVAVGTLVDELDLRFIGFELDPTFCDLAAKRLGLSAIHPEIDDELESMLE